MLPRAERQIAIDGANRNADDRRMRVVAHLIRASDQTHVWAQTYDSDTLDLPQQSSIAEQIASAVVVRLRPRSQP